MAEEEASVKVFVRFRPVNKREQSEKDVSSSEGSLDVCDDASVKLVIKGKENAFTFDRVFTGSSRQEDVYASVASEAIQDVLNGFHATVFAYGQTGAGKSFTMFGGGDESAAGVIPRAAKHIFDHIANSTEAREWSIKVRAPICHLFCFYYIFFFLQGFVFGNLSGDAARLAESGQQRQAANSRA
jgi:hypothetical protein